MLFNPSWLQPRVPCDKQSRKLGLPELRQAVLDSLRTGFYLRVLEPGVVTAGDELQLLARPRPEYSVEYVNACLHRDEGGPQVWAQLAEVPELSRAWQGYFRKRMATATTGR